MAQKSVNDVVALNKYPKKGPALRWAFLSLLTLPSVTGRRRDAGGAA